MRKSSNPGQVLENPGNWQAHSLLTFAVQNIMTAFIKSGIILSTGHSWHSAMHTVSQDLYPKDLIQTYGKTRSSFQREGRKLLTAGTLSTGRAPGSKLSGINTVGLGLWSRADHLFAGRDSWRVHDAFPTFHLKNTTAHPFRGRGGRQDSRRLQSH